MRTFLFLLFSLLLNSEKFTETLEEDSSVSSLDRVKLRFDIYAKDRNGLTLLHKASTSDNLERIKYLVENGADVNAKDEAGRTPLHISADFDKIDTVKYLIEKGADIHRKDKNGRTPIHFASWEGS
ncbi:MAG TPA: ankyrin repeat domain-containing protein, partial [Leptospiraceae bacterium]|nr:ankyrin repeat domain-containing protein [Leptospiraceae bacterium]